MHKINLENLRGHLALLDRARADHLSVSKDSEIQQHYENDEIPQARELSITRYPEHNNELKHFKSIVVELYGENDVGKMIWSKMWNITHAKRLEEIARKAATVGRSEITCPDIVVAPC